AAKHILNAPDHISRTNERSGDGSSVTIRSTLKVAINNVRRSTAQVAALILLIVVVTATLLTANTMRGVQNGAQVQNPADQATPVPAHNSDEVLLAAGDVADCQHLEDATATADILDRYDGTIAALGDLAYESGTADEFVNCYEPTWGRFKARTRPAIGNHEYKRSEERRVGKEWRRREGRDTGEKRIEKEQ